MQKTLFNSSRLHRVLAPVASALLRLTGWRLVGGVPAGERRFVLIAAPHTSNWDFVLMLLAVLKAGIDLHWMGKHTLFRRPFGRLMRWLGGVPIDRTRSNNVVADMVQKFRQRSNLIVLITPEGTRAQSARWRTGFYQIARGAEVPVLLGFVDSSRRELGFGPLFRPCGNIDIDLPQIQAFYQDKRGIRGHSRGGG